MRQLLPALLILTALTVWAPGALVHAAARPQAGEPTAILPEATVVTPVLPAPSAPPAEPTSPADTDPTSPPDVAPTRTPTRTAPAALPDLCEPNDRPERACAIGLDGVAGPFTIAPEADADWYRLSIPDQGMVETVITLRATGGLELLLSARQGGALLATATISLTLAPAIQGEVLLMVENRSPAPAAGERYKIEVRRALAPPPAPSVGPSGLPTLAPDLLENNYSAAAASPIALGVVYDLTLVCPEQRPDACPGGDHDYLRVPVKAGGTYLIATFDLGAGVDTVIDLFWEDLRTPLAGNDDYAPGGALSALRWRAPGDGEAIIRVGPRAGSLRPIVPAKDAGFYRLAVVPVEAALAATIAERIAAQANLPAPTPSATATAQRPTAAPAGGAAGPAQPTPGAGDTTAPGRAGETIDKGEAITLQETPLRLAPGDSGALLAVLPPETVVTVRGPTQGLWVAVEADASILPGWVFALHLTRLRDDGSPLVPLPSAAPASSPPAATAAPAGSTQPTAATAAPQPPTPTAPGATIRPIDPVIPATQPTPPPRRTVAITVRVVTGAAPPEPPRNGVPTPTPDLSRPRAAVRVQLLNAFGDLLAESLTGPDGAIALQLDLRPGDALIARLPALGLDIPLGPGQTLLIVALPETPLQLVGSLYRVPTKDQGRTTNTGRLVLGLRSLVQPPTDVRKAAL